MLDRRPLVAAHRAGARIGQEVDEDVVGVDVEEVVAGGLDGGEALVAVVIRIGSTAWIRNGSMIVRKARASTAEDSRARDRGVAPRHQMRRVVTARMAVATTGRPGRLLVRWTARLVVECESAVLPRQRRPGTGYGSRSSGDVAEPWSGPR